MESGASPDRSAVAPKSARAGLGKPLARVNNGRFRRRSTTEDDGLLHALATLGLRLPFFKPDKSAVLYFNKLTGMARCNEPMTRAQKANLERFRRLFPAAVSHR